MFSNHPHPAPDARFEAATNQLVSSERDLIDGTQGLCVVPFVVHPSVCGHLTWKDSWRERHTHQARRRKSLLSTWPAQAGQTLHRAFPRRRSQCVMSKPVEKMCRQAAAFKRIRAQMPRKLLVPRMDVVRKCLLICSGQEEANTTTIECICGPS